MPPFPVRLTKPVNQERNEELKRHLYPYPISFLLVNQTASFLFSFFGKEGTAIPTGWSW